MRPLFAIFLIVFTLALKANMASPVRPGTYASSAFSSRNIDILHEHILLTPAKDFKTAVYSIEYLVRADSSDNHIPLLFHALDYQGDFRVYLDDRALSLQPLPEDYLQAGTASYQMIFGTNGNNEDNAPKLIFLENDHRSYFEPGDFLYFETDLPRGEHRIRVSYTAKAWTDRSGWVKTYSFRYSLSPARYWRSFGKLTIQLDTSLFAGALQTNLGSPASHEDSRINWHFNKLPADYFAISYTPPVNTLASILIGIGPLWLCILISTGLVLLHILLTRKFRERRPDARFSWILILGSIIVPFLALGSLPFAYDLIDSVIGPDAGRYHGYNFLVIVLYPFVFPVYGLILWWIDRSVKRRLNYSR